MSRFGIAVLPLHPPLVMAGLVPAIHAAPWGPGTPGAAIPSGPAATAGSASCGTAWMAGTSPAMTNAKAGP